MLWDCAFCNTEKLLGKTHRHCPECGAPQDPERRYFPAEDEKIAVEDHVFVGVDRRCPSCDKPNAATARHCGSCGTPMDGAREVRRVATGRAVDEIVFTEEAADHLAPDAPSEPAPAHGDLDAEDTDEAMAAYRAAKRRSTRRSLPFLLLLPVIPLAVVLGFVIEFWTYDAAMLVTSHRWERSIQVEQLSAVSGGDWCDEMPSDGYDVSRSSKVRTTERVADGETCTTRNVDRGDGTFTQEQDCTTSYRTEDVYEDWCSYTIDRWVVDRTVTASGAATEPPPTWPYVPLLPCGSVGCEREGTRSASYWIDLREERKGTAHACDMAQSVWEDMSIGSRWNAKVRMVTGGVKCGSLRAER